MRRAEVAELADALRSGRSGSTPVGVRVPASAPSIGLFQRGSFPSFGGGPFCCPVSLWLPDRSAGLAWLAQLGQARLGDLVQLRRLAGARQPHRPAVGD